MTMTFLEKVYSYLMAGDSFAHQLSPLSEDSLL